MKTCLGRHVFGWAAILFSLFPLVWHDFNIGSRFRLSGISPIARFWPTLPLLSSCLGELRCNGRRRPALSHWAASISPLRCSGYRNGFLLDKCSGRKHHDRACTRRRRAALRRFGASSFPIAYSDAGWLRIADMASGAVWQSAEANQLGRQRGEPGDSRSGVDGR